MGRQAKLIGADRIELYTEPYAEAFGTAKQTAELSIKYRLPMIFPSSEDVEDGGLMAYGANAPDQFRQAATMMDRYNRIFLWTLRALCDMRRLSSPVIVQNGGQMNVAHQQMNLNTPRSVGDL